MNAKQLKIQWDKGVLTTPKYIQALDKLATELEYDKQLQYDTDQMCQKKLMQRNTELEQKLAYFENDGSWNELVFKCELAEQQVKELQEPKTCDGCEYRTIVPYEDCTHWSSTQEDCCIRYNNPTDFYKLKQN